MSFDYNQGRAGMSIYGGIGRPSHIDGHNIAGIGRMGPIDWKKYYPSSSGGGTTTAPPPTPATVVDTVTTEITLKQISGIKSFYGLPMQKTGGRRLVTGVPIWLGGYDPRNASFAISFGQSLNGDAEAQLIRIYFNDVCVLDTEGTFSAGKDDLQYEFYSGSMSQMPDGTIAAKEGLENTPGFRGQIYVVFNNVDLTKYNFFEVPVVRAEIEEDASAVGRYRDYHIPDGARALLDRKAPMLVVKTIYNEDKQIVWVLYVDKTHSRTTHDYGPGYIGCWNTITGEAISFGPIVRRSGEHAYIDNDSDLAYQPRMDRLIATLKRGPADVLAARMDHVAVIMDPLRFVCLDEAFAGNNRHRFKEVVAEVGSRINLRFKGARPGVIPPLMTEGFPTAQNPPAAKDCHNWVWKPDWNQDNNYGRETARDYFWGVGNKIYINNDTDKNDRMAGPQLRRGTYSTGDYQMMFTLPTNVYRARELEGTIRGPQQDGITSDGVNYELGWWPNGSDDDFAYLMILQRNMYLQHHASWVMLRSTVMPDGRTEWYFAEGGYVENVDKLPSGKLSSFVVSAGMPTNGQAVIAYNDGVTRFCPAGYLNIEKVKGFDIPRNHADYRIKTQFFRPIHPDLFRSDGYAAYNALTRYAYRGRVRYGFFTQFTGQHTGRAVVLSYVPRDLKQRAVSGNLVKVAAEYPPSWATIAERYIQQVGAANYTFTTAPGVSGNAVAEYHAQYQSKPLPQRTNPSENTYSQESDSPDAGYYESRTDSQTQAMEGGLYADITATKAMITNVWTNRVRRLEFEGFIKHGTESDPEPVMASTMFWNLSYGFSGKRGLVFMPRDITNDWFYQYQEQAEEGPRKDGAYWIMREFQLFGGDNEGYPLKQFLEDAAKAAGTTEIVIEGVEDNVVGSMLNQETDLIELFTTIGQVFGFEVFESQGKLKIVSTEIAAGAEPKLSLTNADIAPISPSTSRTQQDEFPSFSIQRMDQGDIPARIELGFIDPALNYAATTIYAKRTMYPKPTTTSLATASYGIPLIMTTQDATKRAWRLLYKASAENISFTFRAGRRAGLVEPGDPLRFTDNKSQVTYDEEGSTITTTETQSYLINPKSVTINADWSVSLSAVLYQQAVEFEVDETPYDPQRPGVVKVVGGSVVIVDAPPLSQADAAALFATATSNGAEPTDFTHRFFIASNDETAANQEFSVVRPSYDAEGVFSDNEVIATIRNATVYGRAASSLKDVPVPYMVYEESFTFTTRTPGNFAASGADAAMFDGTNMLLVGDQGRWEYIGYRSMTKNGNQVTVTGLVRGLRGTEAHVGTHRLRDYVLPMSALGTTFSVPAEEIGRVEQFMTQGALQDEFQTSTQYVKLDTYLYEPLAPDNIEVLEESNGDWLVSWRRRSLGNRVSLVNGGSSDPSLYQELDVYAVEVVDPISGTTIRRVDNVAGSSWAYTPAMRGEDGVSGLALSVRIAQKSALAAVGYGNWSRHQSYSLRRTN